MRDSANHPKIERIVAYWRSIAPPGCLPGRQHVDPAEIGYRLLPNVWLMDVERAPLRFRYRLVGTGVVRALGEDRTGKYLDKCIPNLAATVTFRNLTRVATEGVPSYRRGRPFLNTNLAHHIQSEGILLPLARDGATVDMILGLSVYINDEGREV